MLEHSRASHYKTGIEPLVEEKEQNLAQDKRDQQDRVFDSRFGFTGDCVIEHIALEELQHHREGVADENANQRANKSGAVALEILSHINLLSFKEAEGMQCIFLLPFQKEARRLTMRKLLSN